jgi:lincosamide nucleotidyltransferase A/C/D/E
MDAPDVLAVLDLLTDAGVDAWVDGGWGVDALVGERTRAHSDLDLVVPLPSIDTVLAALAAADYARALRDWRPTAVAVADGQGREVDLHLVTPTPDGGGDQALPGGDSFHYPPPVGGTVGGRAVRCVDAPTQVRAHVGYPPSGKDHADMRLLRDRLRVELVPPYACGDT